MAPSEQQPSSQHEQQQPRQHYMPDNKGFKNKVNGRNLRLTPSDDTAPVSSATHNMHTFRSTFDHHPEIPAFYSSNSNGIPSGTPGEIQGLTPEDLSARILSGQSAIAAMQAEVVLLERTLGQRSQVQQLQATVDKHSATIADLKSDLRNRENQNEENMKQMGATEQRISSKLTEVQRQLTSLQKDSMTTEAFLVDNLSVAQSKVDQLTHAAEHDNEIAQRAVAEAERQLQDKELDFQETLSVLSEWQLYGNTRNAELNTARQDVHGLRAILASRDQELTSLRQQLGQPEHGRNQQNGNAEPQPLLPPGPNPGSHVPGYGNVHQQHLRQPQQQQPQQLQLQQQQDREQQPNRAVSSKDLPFGGGLSAIEQRPGARGGMPPMDRDCSGGALLLDDSSLGGLLLDCVPAGKAAASPLHIIATSIKEKLRADGTVWEQHYQLKHGSIQQYLESRPHFACRQDGAWYCRVPMASERAGGGAAAGPNSRDTTVERPGVNNAAAVVTRPAPYQPAGMMPSPPRDAAHSTRTTPLQQQQQQQQQAPRQQSQPLPPPPPLPPQQRQNQPWQENHAAHVARPLQPTPLPPPLPGLQGQGGTNGVPPYPMRPGQTVLVTPPAPQRSASAGTPAASKPAERGAQYLPPPPRSGQPTQRSTENGLKPSAPHHHHDSMPPPPPPPAMHSSTRSTAASTSGDGAAAPNARNAALSNGQARNDNPSKAPPAVRTRPGSTSVTQGGPPPHSNPQSKQSGNTPKAQQAADGGGAPQRYNRKRNSGPGKKKGGSGGAIDPSSQ